MFVCMCVCDCECWCLWTCGGQKRASDSLELKLRVVMMWGAGNSGPVRKECMLLTSEPSLQPPLPVSLEYFKSFFS